MHEDTNTTGSSRRRGRTRARAWRLLTALLAALLLLAACGDSDDSSDDAASTSETTAAASDDAVDFGSTDGSAETTSVPTTVAAEISLEEADVAEEAPDGSLGSGAGATPAVTPADLGRDIVFTAQLTVASDDVAATTQAAVEAVAPLGGLVFGQQTTSGPPARSVVTIKVQPADFSEALARLGAVGELRDQVISADDVTDRVVDLESRIVTAESSVERLRNLLAGAESLEAVAALERELQSREQQLELLRGQLRTIRDAVSLATITVTIVERVEPTPTAGLVIETAAYVGDDGGRGCDTADFPEVTDGDELTVCVEVTNVGEVTVSDLEVVDTVDRRDRVFVPVAGGEVLEPGESATFWRAIEATRSVRLSEPRVTGLADLPDGPTPTSASDSFDLVVDEDTSLPGVGETIGGTITATLSVLYVLLLVAIALTPVLLVAVPIALFVVRRRRAAAARRASAAQSESATSTNDA